ncbi:hypothetical protein D6D28_09029 [Aureobasidium pullulans]|uniref:Uncharacterized protein n=1 Tax=Aureobasidium pullulans TaxID=5580 RepID=A0A4S8S5T7_AURPU|nr:hypothetical protein D6D28_09029 [Aureobasidium pullulans]
MDPSSDSPPLEPSKPIDTALKQLYRTLRREPHLIDVLQNRPHVQIPSSSVNRQRSDPVDHGTALSVVKVIKRGLTDGPRRTLSRKDPMVYAQELFDDMKANLKSLNLNTSRMLRQNFEYLLPNKSTTRDQLTLFDAVRAAPITVTNSELSRILNLELSTSMSPPTQANCQHYYIRSWTFTYQELAALCGHMASDDTRLAEVFDWMSVAAIYRNRTDVFTVRYAGTTLGPQRPYDRYAEDLVQRTSGVLAEFTRAVDTIAPHVAQAAQIFLVKDASVAQSDMLLTLSDPEDRERMLIEFLGHKSLLNRQRGGFFTSYIPFHEDVSLFRDLRTDAWNSFKSTRLNCSDDTVSKLNTLFEDIQAYANNNADLTGTWKFEYSDALRDVSLAQATPYCYASVTPIVFIGKDITEEAYINATPFLAGRSAGSNTAGQAGAFVRDVIQRLADEETIANRRDIVPNSFQADRSFWVFYDLWQWLAHKDLEAAIRFLRRYLSIVRPLVAVAFGLMTNNVTLSNFNSLNGVRLRSYTSLVCNPTIQYYDDAGPKKHDPDHAFINVPMYHPGRDKYGSNSTQIRRLIDMSMRYAFLVVDVAGEVLSERSISRNRLEMCNEILRRMDNLMQTTHAAFFLALTTAKNECASYIMDTYSQSTSEDVRPVLDHAGRQIIQSLGTAKGAPNSLARDIQLNQVWDLNMPELHAVVAHEDIFKQDWKALFLPLQEDQYFYLAVLASLPPDQYLTSLLDTVRPDWATDDSWVHNPSAKDQAIAKVQGGLWISRKRDEDRSNTVQFPSEPVSPRRLHGQQIGFVESNGKAWIRWTRPDGITENTVLTVKSAINKTGFETRTLLFTEHGIDVVSGTGESFRNRFGQQYLATFPLEQLLHNRELYTMWSSVRQAYGHAFPPFGTQFDHALAKDWSKRPGIACLGQVNSEKPQQNRPPHELDALYPLYQYLNIQFPDGGNFYYHAPDKELVRDKRRLNAAPQATVTTENMKQFLEMLDTPEWVKHPYHDFWKQELRGKKLPNVALFTKNLPILRHTTQETFSRGSRPIYWKLGAPGSAVDDPFDPVYEQSCVPGQDGKGAAGKAYKAAKAANASKFATAGAIKKPVVNAPSTRSSKVATPQVQPVSKLETTAQAQNRPSALSGYGVPTWYETTPSAGTAPSAPGSYGTPTWFGTAPSGSTAPNASSLDSATWFGHLSGAPYSVTAPSALSRMPAPRHSPQSLPRSGAFAETGSLNPSRPRPSALSIMASQRQSLKRSAEEEPMQSEEGTSESTRKKSKKAKKGNEESKR